MQKRKKGLHGMFFFIIRKHGNSNKSKPTFYKNCKNCTDTIKNNSTSNFDKAIQLKIVPEKQIESSDLNKEKGG